jgi:curved DNA-binding protein CbpA
LAKRDYYMILGVPPTALPDEIKKAYRMLSKKYHPDLNPDMKTVSDEKMKELVEAYNVLNDSSRRKAYDKQPQFQTKRFAKSSARAKVDKSAFTKKPKYAKEPSLLERLLSPFLKKTSTTESGSVLDPKQADVHFTLGLSMADSETFYDQAKGEFKLTLKFDPKHKEAAYNHALMCYKLGEFEEARIGFQRCLQLDPDDQMARRVLALLHDPML